MKQLLPGLFPRNISHKLVITAACFAAWTWADLPAAHAQRVGGHVGVHVAGPRPLVRPIARPPMARPLTSALPGGVAFGRPFGRFRPFFFGPPFFGPPFFGYGPNLAFDSVFWLTCGPFWGWQPGCGELPGYEGSALYPNYVLAPPYEAPVYVYGRERSDYVQIFLKDGTVFSVADYWFVDVQLHFTTAGEGPKPAEQTVPLDEVDLQKTIDVNTARGFRVVMRNEPWEQYMHDHPNETPPSAQPPQK
jgi:hypothetical protein